MTSAVKLVLNQDTYTAVLREIVPSAKRLLWRVTADIKDLHVEGGRSQVSVPLSLLKSALSKVATGSILCS